MVYDLLNRLGLEAQLQPSTVGEVALASQQLEGFGPGDVEINDRGFRGGWKRRTSVAEPWRQFGRTSKRPCCWPIWRASSASRPKPS